MPRWRWASKACLVTSGIVLITMAAAPAGAATGARTGRSGAAASAPAICHSSRNPAAAARISNGIAAVLSHRKSLVAVRVSDRYVGMSCGLRVGTHFDSASVVKATILAALLLKANDQHRNLTSRERDLAWLMITESDNNAATALWNDVGMRSLQHFLNVAGMKETILGQNGYWGLTQITAHDEMILLKLLMNANTVLTNRDRGYELALMSHVIASERWGVTAGVPTSFTIHVKNGWLPTPPSYDWWINSIGCFTSTTTTHDYAIAVLTWRNPTMNYGVTTVQDIAEVINRNLTAGAVKRVPPSQPYPAWGIPDERIPAGVASP